MRCVNLTNISQHQADSSPHFDKVYERFISLADIYKTTKMFVWGTADRVIVEKSLRFAKFGNIKKKYRCFINYQDNFMQYIRKSGNLKQQISLESAAYICDFDFTHEFNALGDAECLKDIFFAVRSNKINSLKLNKYIEYNEAVNYVSLYKNKQNRLKTLISNNNEIIMRLKRNECEEREALEKKLETNNDLCNSLKKYIDENIHEYTNMVSFVNQARYILTKR
jgi:inhibitor of KinA sporulation pathway (predicted exonuclease)